MNKWYSVLWSPRDLTNPNTFIELDGCPRFVLSEDGSVPSRNKLETQYPSLFVKEIFETQVFVNDETGKKMPTHYRFGIFMPGMNNSYDRWLETTFKINQHILEKVRMRKALFQKNIFLEHSAKIIRHDMHSGINTYLPRGMKMLLDKLPKEVIDQHKLTPALTLLERGLKHTQLVYKGVYAFTNLVKEESQLDKTHFDLQKALEDYLILTSYHNQVKITDLPTVFANQSLLCTAIDNLIRNGLKYNDHKQSERWVKIYFHSDEWIAVEDNGTGMDQAMFDRLCEPYQRGENEKKTGTGLGLNICSSILQEHGFDIKVERLEVGTKINIRVKH
jgi:signal transduction histidine kinase